MQLKKRLIQHKHMKMLSICMSTRLSPTDKNTLLQRKLKLFDSTWKITPCLQLLLEKANNKIPSPYSIRNVFPVVQFFLFPCTKQWDGWLETYSESFWSTHTSCPVPENWAHHWTTFTIILSTLQPIQGLAGSSRDHPLFPFPIRRWAHWQLFRTWTQSHPKILLKIHGCVNMHACVCTYVCNGIGKDSNSDLLQTSQKRTVSQREWNCQLKRVKMGSFSYKTSISKMHK